MGLGWTPFQSIIAIVMVITGSINTLSVKWANLIPSRNTIGECVPFNHPFLQSCGMFLGEFLCMGAFYVTLCWSARSSRRNPPGSLNPMLAAGAEKPEDDTNKGDEEKVGSSSEEELQPDEPELKPFSLAKAYLLLPAALCDMTGTSVMYVALTLTSASSFQMLRGAVIIFTGVNSMVFLKRRLEWFRWLGMAVIVAGLVIVGAADLISPEDPKCYDNTTMTTIITTIGPNLVSTTPSTLLVLSDSSDSWSCDAAPVIPLEPLCGASDDAGQIAGIPKSVFGDILVIIAQVIVSFQMVYEEKVLSNYAIAPLQAVGSEGFFGFVLMILALVGFAYIPTDSLDWGHSPMAPYYLEDAHDGLYQLFHNGLLLFSFLMTVFSIAFFNFAGITVTKELSATTRMVLDSVRTLIIWAFSLAVGWQSFQYLQPIGFVVLLVGMCLYNDLLIRPAINNCLSKD